MSRSVGQAKVCKIIGISAAAAAANVQVSVTGNDMMDGPARVMTTPQRLLAVIQQQQQQQQSQHLAPGSPLAPGRPAAAAAAAAAADDDVLLPSGERRLLALQQLQEDVTEYDQHVHRKMTSRDFLDRL